MDNEPWKPPLKAVASSSIDDLELIFSESKERLKDLNEDAERLYQRSISFLTFSIVALSTIIGYLGTQKFSFSVTNINLMAVCIVFTVICFKLRNNISPHNYKALGTMASKLFKEEFFTNLGDKPPEWLLLLNLIRDYELRFNINAEINKERTRYVKDSINWLFYIPILTLLIWILGLLFQPYFPFFS